MIKCGLVAVVLGIATTAQTQPADFSVTVGLKGWNTQWTTFTFANTNADDVGDVLPQVAARDKLVAVPVLGVRYGDFVGSISGYRATRYAFIGGGGDQRSELDANVGYLVLPGLAVTLGYKRVIQRGEFLFKMTGPVLGLSATAPLSGPFSLYGALGVGRLKTPPRDDVKKIVGFDRVDYRLTEAGIAYNLPMSGMLKTLTFTAGYRIQILSSKDALEGQDGRDTTQGLTFGLLATF